MGLRIIDRKKTIAVPAHSPSEWKSCLEASTSEWIRNRGDAQPQTTLERFMETIEGARGKISSQDQAFQLVSHMSARLKSGWSKGFEPHQKVDIATLLVLL